MVFVNVGGGLGRPGGGCFGCMRGRGRDLGRDVDVGVMMFVCEAKGDSATLAVDDLVWAWPRAWLPVFAILSVSTAFLED